MKVILPDVSALEKGIELFNRGEYFDAHEAWDGLWFRAEDTQVKRFVQGLIMAAAAFHLGKKGRCPGAAVLIARSIPLLRNGVKAHPDLKLSDFIHALELLRRDQQWCSRGYVANQLPKINREDACCVPHA